MIHLYRTATPAMRREFWQFIGMVPVLYVTLALLCAAVGE